MSGQYVRFLFVSLVFVTLICLPPVSFRVFSKSGIMKTIDIIIIIIIIHHQMASMLAHVCP